MTRDFELRTVDPGLVERYTEQGLWGDDSLGRILVDGLAAGPDRRFRIHSRLRPWHGTFGEVLELSRRVAGGLRDRGVDVGDLVAFQLPNWIEAAAVFYATTLLGAVPVPIVHFYGPTEVGYILRESQAEVFVTGDRFGQLDFLATLETIRPEAPALGTVVVVGDTLPDDAVAFGRLTEAIPVDAPADVDPGRPGLIAYTSGTTSEPKGVIHTHRTIVAECRQLAAVQPDDIPPTLVGAPVGHGIGLLAALLLPIVRGESVHLIDAWEPGRVLELMAEHHLLSGTGATFFLTSLLDHPDFTDEHRRLMSKIGLGGSVVPDAVGERAAELGISTVRLYGSTEHPSTTGASHDEPTDKRLYTDGRPLPGCEIWLRSLDGGRADVGEAGEVMSRGPDCFAGYTDPGLTDLAFDDGWYASGDVGVVDTDGYLTITDRIKDIIIRGGETISATEIEDLLLRLDDVAEAAVIAAPDERLGEHAAAFVRHHEDADRLELDDVQAHLERAGIAKQKWPEELHEVTDFPRTPTGKVQKFVLRDRLDRA